jgi:hypothetical protein
MGKSENLYLGLSYIYGDGKLGLVAFLRTFLSISRFRSRYSYIGGDVKFTANNIAEKYVGHCVEVYGKVEIESNTYNGNTAQQPVIHVNSASDIKFCDNKFISSP